MSIESSSTIAASHTLLFSLRLMFHISCTSSGSSCWAIWAPLKCTPTGHVVKSNVTLCFVMKSYPTMTGTMRLSTTRNRCVTSNISDFHGIEPARIFRLVLGFLLPLLVAPSVSQRVAVFQPRWIASLAEARKVMNLSPASFA